ncbi:C39 family peptidase [Singulisphaera sp. PoT]|uniref:C39 family peptidase n=1 Tax=Singulisphaera sp. PoT TaxID=3411797 RepID=UPI003BF4D87C
MSTTTERDRITIAPADLDRIREIYESGLYLQAFEESKAWGPLETWEGTPALILAGRLAMNLGGPKLAERLHTRAWRLGRNDFDACFYRALSILGKKGPYATWRFLKRSGPFEGISDSSRADWSALHGIVLGYFRDFDRAWAWMDRAEATAPGSAWIHLERSRLLGMEDRYEESLAAAEHALTLRPWYRPAVQSVVHCLQLLDRDHEAIDRLMEAGERIESPAIFAQLGALQFENDRFEEARRSYDRCAELSPLQEDDGRKWLAGRRSDCAYGCGDVESTIRYAKETDEPFFKALAERLEANAHATRRVVLDVGFVRQHHHTCAPATLAAISRFWGIPADQHEVAEAICYDGTPDHRERTWAGDNGWFAREFTVTWDSIVALIDRKIPFTLTTVDPLSAHLQAVIGYDERRRTLIVRDPTEPYSVEAFADAFLERYRSSGPRGMLLIPKAQADRIDGVELPDATLYDLHHEVQCELLKHDRIRAFAAYERLLERCPGHRLTFQAARQIAAYDTDTPAYLAAIEGLIALFPEDTNYRFSQLGCLGELARTDERLGILQTLCDDPKSDPYFRRLYAEELLPDDRERARVYRLVRQAMRARPLDATSYSILAELAWNRQERDEALELYRFATALDDKNEGFARSHFMAARHLRREQETLEMLRQRFRRFGTRSSYPARTLYWALSQLDREAEGFRILDEAVALRPDDSDLQLFLADSLGNQGEFERAEACLASVEGKCRRAAWLRTAATLFLWQGKRIEALQLWREVLEIEPDALDANRNMARLLAETENQAAAIEHLARACDRFPHNVALHQSLIQRLRDESPIKSEEAARRLLASRPTNAWTRRELALILGEQGRYEEALAEVEVARQLDPSSSTAASVRGQVLTYANRTTEADAAFREAIRLSVDNELAIARLINGQASPNGRREAIRFIEEELGRQVIFGDGLIAFARHARNILSSDELLATLEKAWEARPDLWHAWAALIRHRLERKELDEALDLANRAVERFPLLPVLWADLASVHEARGDGDQVIEALNRSLRISPGWGMAARQLASAYESRQDFETSKAVIERSLAHAPLDPLNHGFLADALWSLNDRKAALDRIRHAIRLDPEYDWAWSALRRWSHQMGQPESVAELARELTQIRGGDSCSWMKLAENLEADSDRDERLEALQRVIDLEPRRASAYDLRAELLADAGRLDEAESACNPPAWDGDPPCFLRGRAAWVEFRRGNYPSAIEKMQSVLEQDPDYYWGWLRLSEWLCDTSTPEAYLQAAENLIRLAPNDTVANAYIGEARLKTGDRRGAKAGFRAAFDLNPSYGFAGMNLFDLEMEDEAWDAAEAVLEALKEHVGGDFVLAREIRLAMEQNRISVATEALTQLCVSTLSEGDWPLRAADKAFRKAGWSKGAEAVYSGALDLPDVNPLVGRFWVEHWTERKHWKTAKRLDSLAGRGELGGQILAAYLNFLGNAKWERRILACLRRYEQAIRANTHAWGTVGYALTSVHKYDETIAWMSDWDDREGLQPWMLMNLVIALRNQTLDAVANFMSQKALELPSDYSSHYHSLWLAFDEVLDGHADRAAARLEAFDTESFDVTNLFLHDLTTLLIQRAEAIEAGDLQVRAMTWKHINKLCARYTIPSEDHGAVSNAVRRAIAHAADQEGGFRGFVWRHFGAKTPRRKSR